MIGRQREREALRALLTRTAAGNGGAIVVEGEPGIGKSSLLRAALPDAEGWLRASCTGVEAERELPYSSLSQLIASLPDRSDILPQGQTLALRVALGGADGPAPRPLLVALALLGVLRACAEERPVLCTVDDAHWIDGSSAQVLGFVARRLRQAPVAMIFAARSSLPVPALDGIARLRLAGLDGEDALRLVREEALRPVDDAVARRIADESHGNPLLIRLACAALPFAAPLQRDDPAQPALERITRGFAEQLALLPRACRTVLALAAADPTGDPVLVARAAAVLGLGLEALVPAEDAGLVRVGTRIAFDHPLIRTAAYGGVSLADRLELHAALAAATDPDRDPDRRAWHLASATSGLSDEIAVELELSASRAGARGGYLAAAAFYRRAAELGESHEKRIRASLAAARSLELGGAHRAALALLDDTRERAASPTIQAQIDQQRGRILFSLERSPRAADLLLAAARELRDSRPAASREAYLEALSAATMAQADPDGEATRRMSAAIREDLAAQPPGTEPVDELLAAMLALALDPTPIAIGEVRGRLSRFATSDIDAETATRWLWVAARLASIGWDEGLWEALTTAGESASRSTGALTALAAVRASQTALAVLRGDGALAADLVAETAALWEQAGAPHPPYGRVVLAAWQGAGGDETPFEAELAGFRERGEGMGEALVLWARALHANATGRYPAALEWALTAARYPATMLYSGWALIEAVEAATRVGDTAAASASLRRLQDWTDSAGTPWAIGVRERARALVATEPDAVEMAFRSSIDHLSSTGLATELARSRLLYGEWLRRHRRRSDAREQLSAAREIFTRLDAAAFLDRTRNELAGAGAAGSASPGGHLSAQEARVAQLAAEGLSNAQIAERLHLSANTVDFHLRKVFRKLGVSSRVQLHLVLGPAVPGSPSREESWSGA